MEKPDYLQIILESIGQVDAYALPMTDKAKQGIAKIDAKIKDAKRFSLDVQLVKETYNRIANNPQSYSLNMWGDFKPPFDTCLIAFKEPITIKWDIGIPDQVKYVNKPLIGFMIAPFEESKEQFVHSTDVKHNNEEINFFHQTYTISLYFLEDIARIEKEQGKKLDTDYVIGNQFIVVRCFQLQKKPQHETFFLHMQHYPCGDPLLCNIDTEGKDRFPSVKKAWVCEEIVTRHAFVQTIFHLFNKFTEQQTITKEKEKQQKLILSNKPYSLPEGFENKAIKMPTENYVSPIKDTHYKYNKQDIAHGTGTAHRFQYDVRRHPRIIGNKIVWINPYKRGEGEYIQKVYTNSGTWLINYTLRYTEKLTKYRWFEVLLIQTIKLIRRFH